MSESNNENNAQGVPEVSLNDFASIVRIIDVASRRGAFEGKELSSVGAIRDKVEAFVVHYAPKQNEEGDSAGSEVEGEPAEAPIENIKGE